MFVMPWEWADVSHHVDALLLALASSTDNFTVGLSVGIRQKSLPLWANGCISACNAAGAWVAGHGGLWVSLYFTSTTEETSEGGSDGGSHSFPLYLSAMAFGGLSLSEWRGYKEETSNNNTNGKKDDGEKFNSSNDFATNNTPVVQSTMNSIWPVLKLAIPMTLNNLAGGVAGGAAGLTPQMSAFYALLASFVTMLVGYRAGLRVGSAMMQSHNSNKTKKRLYLHPSLLSAVLLGILCILTLREAIFD